MSNIKYTGTLLEKFDLLKVDFIVEWLKEMARVALAAAVPLFIVVFEDGDISASEWKLLYVTAALAVAKGIDRALHETKIEEKGLLRF